MYQGNLTKVEKAIIKKAAQLEIEIIRGMLKENRLIQEVSELIHHPEKVPSLDLKILVDTRILLEQFQALEKDPDRLFRMDIAHLDIVTVILTEFFEEEWEAEVEDTAFIALCNKLITFIEFIETNQTTLN